MECESRLDKRRLRDERFVARRPLRKPRLQIGSILAWADEHFARTRRWPKASSGTIVAAPHETWAAVSNALSRGGRGLPGGSSIPKLLATHRSVRNRGDLPPLTTAQILAWADAHRRRTGRWPLAYSGKIIESPGDRWSAVDTALRVGARALPGGSSLAKLLVEARRVRNPKVLRPWGTRLPSRPSRRGQPLTIDAILTWAKIHQRTQGAWPQEDSGQVLGAPGERWKKLDKCLRYGLRGLPGGDSLARLLERQFGVRNRGDLPKLTLDQVLAWADDHFKRTGSWPTTMSGPVAAAARENWANIALCLNSGFRGLRGGHSLNEVLAANRGVRNTHRPPPLTLRKILSWADYHYAKHGKWPQMYAGAVEACPGESWAAVDDALKRGGRSLPGGSSLAILLHLQRNVPYKRKHVRPTGGRNHDFRPLRADKTARLQGLT